MVAAGEPTGDGGGNDASASYGALLTDVDLLTILLISFAGLFAVTAVPPALPGIGAAFDVSESRVGLVISLFSLPLVLMLPVSGLLADVYGRRRIAIPALALFGTAGLATLFVDSFWTLLVLRGVQGIGFAGTVPLTATMIGDRFTGVRGSTAQGLRVSTHGLAATLGPAVAGFLAAISWEFAFLPFALALPVLVLVAAFYREPVDGTMGRESSFADVRREFAGYWTAIRVEATDRVFAVMFGGAFFMFVVKQGIKTFVPLYAVNSAGMSVGAAGLVLSVYGGVRIVAPPVAGPAVERIGRRATLVGSFLLLAVGTAGLPFVTTFPVLCAFVAVAAAGDAIVNPVVTDAVAAAASRDHRAGIMSGLSMSKESGNVVSPVVLGLVLAATDYTWMFLVSAGLAVCYGLVFVVVGVPTRGAD